MTRHAARKPTTGRGTFGFLTMAGLSLLLVLLAGCGKTAEDAALDSDANGFLCLDCKAKFYTERKVFANHCPACKQPRVELVMGFVCPGDQHTSYGPRGRGFAACEKCGKITNALVIPRKAELVGWGAQPKTAAEVGAP
jgi:hypothetical protein